MVGCSILIAVLATCSFWTISVGITLSSFLALGIVIGKLVSPNRDTLQYAATTLGVLVAIVVVVHPSLRQSGAPLELPWILLEVGLAAWLETWLIYICGVIRKKIHSSFEIVPDAYY